MPLNLPLGSILRVDTLPYPSSFSSSFFPASTISSYIFSSVITQ